MNNYGVMIETRRLLSNNVIKASDINV